MGWILDADWDGNHNFLAEELIEKGGISSSVKSSHAVVSEKYQF